MFNKKTHEPTTDDMPEQIGPWEMLDDAAMADAAAILSPLFPDLHLAPVAKRVDTTMYACFDRGADGKGKGVVVVYEGGSASGVVRRYAGFTQWFDAALADTPEA